MTLKIENRNVIEHYTFRNWIANQLQNNPSPTQTSFSWINSRQGVELSNWRYLIRTGHDATTDYTVSHRDVNLGFGLVQMNGSDSLGRPWVGEVRGAILSNSLAPDLPSSSDLSAIDTRARLQFLKKYRQARTTFTGGTFFGELAESVRMLKSPAYALRKSVDTLIGVSTKRLRRVPRPSRHRVITETYLEYSYGWKPLISDIVNALDLLKARPDRYSLPIVGLASQPVSRSTFTRSMIFGSVMAYDVLVDKAEEASVRYKGAVNTLFERPPSFAEQMGFTPSEILPTVWELIPYSFLVDYFSNIGKVIDGMSLGTVSLAWGCRTERRRNTYRLAGVKAPRPGFVTSVRNPQYHVYVYSSGSEAKTFKRNKVTSVSVGLSDIHFRIPGVDEPWKWLNIAALSRAKLPRS